MKEKWLMACDGSWNDAKPRITTALESGFDCVIVKRQHIDRVRELGGIKVACFGTERGPEDIIIIGRGGEGDGSVSLPDKLERSVDIALAKTIDGPKAGYVVVAGKRYEEFAVELGRHVDYLIVIGTDWKVIPLENMIAGLQGTKTKIISGVNSAQEAGVALSTLEKGSDGILLDTADISEIKRVSEAAEQSEMGSLKLSPVKITAIKAVGMGDRVCVDTCSLMRVGEGMLIGSQSRAYFLVQSESEDSPYVAARPFRVNAGAVHAYVKVGEKTRYLSELKSGDEVTVVDKEGRTRTAIVGRSKIEKRPMMLIEAEADCQRMSTLLQNAETIKLVGADGLPRSVADLKVGDEVLAYLESGGRHFGMSIEESIIEK